MFERTWFSECIKEYIDLMDISDGIAWDIFWNFRAKTDIFDVKNTEISSMHLFCYLACFGMARASTKLMTSNLIKFEEFYKKSLDSFKALNEIRFIGLKEDQKTEFNKNYSIIEQNLKELNVSSTYTMITKILMAVTGQTPAFDSYFVYTFRKKVGGFSGNIFNSLIMLNKKYKGEWKEEIGTIDKKYTYIRLDEKIETPTARLIDMAFWIYCERNIGTKTSKFEE